MKHFPATQSTSINHNLQRYNTIGDYWELNNVTQFRVSKMSDWRYEALVLTHELIEYIIIKHQGISIQEIDDWDIAFEKVREKGNTDEPGDDKRAPYYKAHTFATKIERMLAVILKVNWKQYEKTISNL